MLPSTNRRHTKELRKVKEKGKRYILLAGFETFAPETGYTFYGRCVDF